ncbi:unnamed protein product [Vitrella brassicaformis CCMP3155]|uniref:RING-type domain-containing protein n=1 Tax=Vitrella brassicaformis (strain CCMP3155) TaxID=1169540 RepID=A0A0G4F2A3_VITBC|nr:unnamed protein product [Vitrella brassicaformis CCMP3155]|eukprot:CEM05761.1 unnamed protein product [Vitrella brassicaformis CCMP3155]
MRVKIWPFRRAPPVVKRHRGGQICREMAPLPQCGVCLEDYHHEDAHRQPHGLRCGHSFCAACVEGRIGSHPHGHPFAVCPTCRRETPQSDVHINYGLRDIVEQLRKATAAAPTDPTTPAVPPSGQDAPLTARQRRQQENADYTFEVPLSNEINATDSPSPTVANGSGSLDI